MAERLQYGYAPQNARMNDKRTNWEHWHLTWEDKDGQKWYQYLPSYMSGRQVRNWIESHGKDITYELVVKENGHKKNLKDL